MFYLSITKFVFLFKSLSDSSGEQSAIFHQSLLWLKVHMSRLLFVGSYCISRSCGWLSGNGKEEKMHRKTIKLSSPSLPQSSYLHFHTCLLHVHIAYWQVILIKYCQYMFLCRKCETRHVNTLNIYHKSEHFVVVDNSCSIQ